MASVNAVRSLLRSSATRSTATRFSTAISGGSKFKSTTFQFPKQKPASISRIFRVPVELSCCVESLLPYHTATASALMTSMLSASPCRYGWTPEDCNDDV